MGEILKIVAEEPEPITFEAFWLLYPRKVAKKDARRAWDRIPPRLYADILQGVANWRQVWLAKDLQYCPHPSTFLNGERWEDELPPGYRPVTAVRAVEPQTDTGGTARTVMPDHIRALIERLKK